MLEINKQSEKTRIISCIIQYGGENGILCTQNHNTIDTDQATFSKFEKYCMYIIQIQK